MSDTKNLAGYLDMVEDAVRANPIAASLVGMGVAWLFTGGGAASVLAGVARQTQSNKAHETVADTMAAAQEAAGHAGDLVQGMRQRLTNVLTEQPLLLAAGGLALGAAIAASLPSTEVERHAFGQASDATKTQVGAFIDAQAGQAKRALHDAAAAAKIEAERQGLTPGAIKADAQSFAADARNAITGSRA